MTFSINFANSNLTTNDKGAVLKSVAREFDFPKNVLNLDTFIRNVQTFMNDFEETRLAVDLKKTVAKIDRAEKTPEKERTARQKKVFENLLQKKEDLEKASELWEEYREDFTPGDRGDIFACMVAMVIAPRVEFRGATFFKVYENVATAYREGYPKKSREELETLLNEFLQTSNKLEVYKNMKVKLSAKDYKTLCDQCADSLKWGKTGGIRLSREAMSEKALEKALAKLRDHVCRQAFLTAFKSTFKFNSSGKESETVKIPGYATIPEEFNK